MREGELVVVAAPLSDVLGKTLGEQPVGTVVQVDGKNIWVLFPNGFIWVGPIHHTYPPQN